MNPRVDITAVAITDSYEQVKQTIIRSGFSRIPVYEGDLDNIKGTLYVKDLLSHIDKISKCLIQLFILWEEIFFGIFFFISFLPFFLFFYCFFLSVYTFHYTKKWENTTMVKKYTKEVLEKRLNGSNHL